MEYHLTLEEAMKKTPEQVLDEIIGLCKARYDKLTKIIPEADFRNNTPKEFYDGFEAGVHTVYIGEVIAAWRR